MIQCVLPLQPLPTPVGKPMEEILIVFKFGDNPQPDVGSFLWDPKMHAWYRDDETDSKFEPSPAEGVVVLGWCWSVKYVAVKSAIEMFEETLDRMNRRDSLP